MRSTTRGFAVTVRLVRGPTAVIGIGGLRLLRSTRVNRNRRSSKVSRLLAAGWLIPIFSAGRPEKK